VLFLHLLVYQRYCIEVILELEILMTIVLTSKPDSQVDFDQKDPSDSSASHEPDELQFQVMLKHLSQMESMILQIQDYSFDHKKS
jgi:hypothetical protein